MLTLTGKGLKIKRMNLFAGEIHEVDEDKDIMPLLNSQATETEMLDYMVLVLSKFMSCGVAFKGGYMLNQLLKGYSRMTNDVDFSIGMKNCCMMPLPTLI